MRSEALCVLFWPCAPTTEVWRQQQPPAEHYAELLRAAGFVSVEVGSSDYPAELEAGWWAEMIRGRFWSSVSPQHPHHIPIPLQQRPHHLHLRAARSYCAPVKRRRLNTLRSRRTFSGFSDAELEAGLEELGLTKEGRPATLKVPRSPPLQLHAVESTANAHTRSARRSSRSGCSSSQQRVRGPSNTC